MLTEGDEFMCSKEDCGCKSDEKKCNCKNGGGCSSNITPLINNKGEN